MSAAKTSQRTPQEQALYHYIEDGVSVTSDTATRMRQLYTPLCGLSDRSIKSAITARLSGDIKLDNGLWAGSVWLGSDTMIGPVYLAYGRAEGGNDAFYLLLGRTFGRFGRGIFRR